MFEERKVHVIDGSFTTQLNTHIKDVVIDEDPLWSSRYLYDNPYAVINTHYDFINAGADIIETNTYQASVQGFMKHLHLSHEKSINLIKTSVDLARGAIERYHYKSNRNIMVAGSIGPYGVHLHDGSEYTGSYIGKVPIGQIKQWHKPRIAALVDAGVDLIAFETQPSKVEAAMLVELLKEYPSCKGWLSFSCRDDGVRISSGERFYDAAKYCYYLNPAQLVAVGVNCLDPYLVEPLIRSINSNKRMEPIPLVVYPNSGEKYDKQLGEWVNKPTNFEQLIPNWLNMGVRYVGGCCRTRPDTIKKIQEVVDKWVSKGNDG